MTKQLILVQLGESASLTSKTPDDMTLGLVLKPLNFAVVIKKNNGDVTAIVQSLTSDISKLPYHQAGSEIQSIHVYINQTDARPSGTLFPDVSNDVSEILRKHYSVVDSGVIFVENLQSDDNQGVVMLVDGSYCKSEFKPFEFVEHWHLLSKLQGESSPTPLSNYRLAYPNVLSLAGFYYAQFLSHVEEYTGNKTGPLFTVFDGENFHVNPYDYQEKTVARIISFLAKPFEKTKAIKDFFSRSMSTVTGARSSILSALLNEACKDVDLNINIKFEEEIVRTATSVLEEELATFRERFGILTLQPQVLVMDSPEIDQLRKALPQVKFFGLGSKEGDVTIVGEYSDCLCFQEGLSEWITNLKELFPSDALDNYVLSLNTSRNNLSYFKMTPRKLVDNRLANFGSKLSRHPTPARERRETMVSDGSIAPVELNPVQSAESILGLFNVLGTSRSSSNVINAAEPDDLLSLSREQARGRTRGYSISE